MLRMLGQSEYGLYSLAYSAVSYLSLLSFGFAHTIIRYLSKYRAEKDRESEEITYGFFLIVYMVLAIVVMIIGIVISNNVEAIFHRGLTNAELDKMRVLVILMTFNTALSFPISVFSSVVIAYERFVFRKLVDMIATVAAPLANLIALYLGYSSVGMVVAATMIQFLMLPINIFYCGNKLKIHPKFMVPAASLIKEMIGFSFYIFLGSIVDMLFWATDKVILGMLVSTVAVAVYNVGGTFNNIVINLSSSMSSVLTPKITGMVVKDASKDELTSIFVRIGRLQFVIVALIVSGFTVFGRTFILLWAGNEYIDAYWVAILTLFPLCVPLIQNTGLSIVVAQNKHRFRSVVYLIIAIINVVSTYITVPTMGIIGAALCSCVAYIIGQGLIMNIYYYRVINIDVFLFWKNILKMSTVPLVMMIGGIFVLSRIHIDNWLVFMIGVVIYTAIYSICMYVIILNDYEKDIIRKPVNKLQKLIVSRRS